MDEYLKTRRNQQYFLLAEREWMFEHRQLWELERHDAFNENRISTRFIGRQPNLETSFTKCISIKGIKSRKKVQRLSQKLNNQNIKSL
jgi:hypothetical protein